MIEITRLTKSGGSLSKSISLGADGRLVCDSSACVMGMGSARRILLEGLDDLGDVITNMLGLEAIALGALRDGLPDKVDITTKAKLNLSGPQPVDQSSPGLSWNRCRSDLQEYHAA